MKVDQFQFHIALRDPIQNIPAGLIDDKGDPAGRRFNVYRNNVTTSLMDALTEGFPVICKLLGEANFRNLAREYQASHPPKSPLMMYYGAEFPDFLDGFTPLAKYPYLKDVARLEYAMRLSYHSADAAPIDPTILGELTESRLLASTVDFAPSMQVVSSRYPMLGIWRFNTIDEAPQPAPKSESALITRAEFDPEPVEISNADVEMISALKSGRPLSAALTNAQAIDPNHDFGRILGQLLTGNAITKITCEEQQNG